MPVKIDKWDGNAVKNALDDAAKKVRVVQVSISISVEKLFKKPSVFCTT